MKKKVLFFYPRFVDRYQELLEANIPEAEFLVCRDRGEIETAAPEAEIALVGMTFPQDLFRKMPKLEWVQVMAAGVDNFVNNAELFKDIPVCRVQGVFGKYMAEYVLAYALFSSQKIGRVLKAQEEKRWDPFLMEFLHQKTMGIMGLGNIGAAVAQKARAMGLRVISWDLFKKEATFVDRQYGIEEMREFLKEADYVVLTLPATPDTVDLIGRDAFQAMKKTAYLINICRGAVVDEKSLVKALKGGEIAGAVLDVVKQEPLPPESDLWDCPNLILTPHVSGPSLPEDMVGIFKENFGRYLRKEPLVGLVDFERGF